MKCSNGPGLDETKRGYSFGSRKRNWSPLPLALSGWLSFRNFGTPGVIGWATFRGSKHMNLVQLDGLSLTVNGSAPKFSKRTILAGLVSFLLGF
jgi:hypothetical protein